MNLKALIIFLLLCKTIFPQYLWQVKKDTLIKWHYLDGDEFTDSTINTNKWGFNYGWARSIYANKEQQYYTDGENHKVKKGILSIFAIKNKKEAKLVDYLKESDSVFGSLNLKTFEYLSGMLQSKIKYRFGYFEIKCSLPKDHGYWPAFWLYGGTPNEEIDWFECKTEKQNQIHVGRHSKLKKENKFRHGLSLRKKWWGTWIKFRGDLSDGFHVISGEWNPYYIKFFLNGECIAYSKIKLNEPKHLVVNLAVPSDNGPFKPGPKKNNKISGDFQIDYIRIWSNNEEFRKISENILSDNLLNIPKTKLTSKSKMHYGNKNLHKNDGIIISLFPINEEIYELTVLGKEVKENLKLKTFDKDGEMIFEYKLIYGVNKISIKKGQLLKLSGAYQDDVTLFKKNL
jgi:beta-glucanase (GH16 family)